MVGLFKFRHNKKENGMIGQLLIGLIAESRAILRFKERVKMVLNLVVREKQERF